MQRIPEPELMDEAEQARAYAEADFEAAHETIIDYFSRVFPGVLISGRVLDLGCGPADISVRFAKRHPACVIDGIDGAEAMLSFGRQRLLRESLEGRINLKCCYLPTDELPLAHYDAIISNSLLHHLHQPAVLWDAINTAAGSGCYIYVVDLMRPDSPQSAQALVDANAAGEPEVLQRDFYNSLLAAFTPQEIAAQLKIAGLEYLHVEPISDRHLIVYGRKP